MTKQKFPEKFLKQLKSVTGKRPKRVIDHIMKHGFVTTEELRTQYGYNHPPRAARDVREEGIPLETFRVKDSQGRSVGAYRFADPSKARFGLLEGRKAFSKKFKQEIIDSLGCKCSVCLESYEDRYLQIDHRVPYEVAGDVDTEERLVADYMLLCGSCNRAKSWSCEHCVNWIGAKDSKVCEICYWAKPEEYKHIALKEIRRLDVVWSGEEIAVYEALKQRAAKAKNNVPNYVKAVLKQHTTTPSA